MLHKWKEYLPILLLAVAGMGFLAYGLRELLIPQAPVVEIIKAEATTSPSPSTNPEIIIDISGAVEHPGVYSLPKGSRVSDALIIAGGISPLADKNYLSRNVNLAAFLSDGSKIYILKKGEAPSGVVEGIALGSQSTNNQALQQININTASSSELDELWGIGASRASDIISNRPYSNLEELKSKAKIPDNVFEKIKTEISL